MRARILASILRRNSHKAAMWRLLDLIWKSFPTAAETPQPYSGKKSADIAAAGDVDNKASPLAASLGKNLPICLASLCENLKVTLNSRKGSPSPDWSFAHTRRSLVQSLITSQDDFSFTCDFHMDGYSHGHGWDIHQWPRKCALWMYTCQSISILYICMESIWQWLPKRILLQCDCHDMYIYRGSI